MEDLEARLIELEVKTAWQDDLLANLNQQIVQMRDLIDLQQAQLRLLYERMQNNSSESISNGEYNPLDEVPPHY